MRNALIKFIPGLLLLSLLANSACAQGRIGTADMKKLITGYWKSKQALAALDQNKLDLEKTQANQISDWKKAKEDYETLRTSANDQAVSATERERRQKLADDKLQQVRDAETGLASYERYARTTLEEQMRRMQGSVVAEIRTVLEAKAKAAGYALVLDATGESFNGTPLVLYSNGENDLTRVVLEQLNATAPPDGQPSGPPTAKPDRQNK